MLHPPLFPVSAVYSAEHISFIRADIFAIPFLAGKREEPLTYSQLGHSSGPPEAARGLLDNEDRPRRASQETPRAFEEPPVASALTG